MSAPHDDQQKSYNGAQPYDGSRRAVEVITNHSAGYDGVYASNGRFAEDLQRSGTADDR